MSAASGSPVAQIRFARMLAARPSALGQCSMPTFLFPTIATAKDYRPRINSSATLDNSRTRPRSAPMGVDGARQMSPRLCRPLEAPL